jgi:hypothetical protein
MFTKIFSRNYILLLATLAAALVAIFGTIFLVRAASGDNLSGYAWSSTIGWVSMNCTTARNPINNINTDSLPKPVYTSSDISVFTPSNKDEIKKYGNLFAKTYLDALAPVAAHPERFSDDLINIGEIYKKIGESLIKIKAPAEVAEKQLSLANGFAVMAKAFPLVNGQQKDPVKALLGLQVVKDSMENQVRMFTDMNTYFRQNGILFEKGEPGALWNNLSASVPENI